MRWPGQRRRRGRGRLAMSPPWSWKKRNLEGGSEEESVVRRGLVEVVAREEGSGRESVARVEKRPFLVTVVGWLVGSKRGLIALNVELR